MAPLPDRLEFTPLRVLLPVLAAAGLAACAEGGVPGGGGSGEEAADPGAAPTPAAGAPACDPDDGGLVLPNGFCAAVFHPGVGPARHLDVRDDGAVFVALENRRTTRGGPVEPGGVVVLTDTDGDGRADEEARWGHTGGNEVLLDGEHVYLAPDDAVLRYTVPAGTTTPAGPPDTLVHGLPDDRNHAAKSVALGLDGDLFVNIGAPSNACQSEPRTEGSPGLDPCPQLEDRAGIWRFAGDATHQTQADGERFATGLRNVVALRTDPRTGQLWGVVHGRDQLHSLFPDLYTVEENAAKPSEQFVRIDEGDDFGWPYCYHDPALGTHVLAPEYGGDGTEVGRCEALEDPAAAFPAHWAPNDLEFYTGDAFPPPYRGGAFIAFHGSWNRAPLPQEGYNVVVLPFEGTEPGAEWEVFAEGFRPADPAERTDDNTRRPTGVAMGPDGALYVSDSREGRVWRIVPTGG